MGMTLIEVLVVVSIIGILLAIVLPAIQYARSSARRLDCSNRMRQLAVSLHLCNDARRSLPSGINTNTPGIHQPRATWIVKVLPYLEEEARWHRIEAAYAIDSNVFHNPPHEGMGELLPIVACPADERTRAAQITRNQRLVGLTSYVGVNGTDYESKDGVLFGDSHVALTEISDGTSATLLLGERPPSPDFFYGWWYGGVGQNGTGSVTIVLGVREINCFFDGYGQCYRGPFHFRRGEAEEPCDRFHFWSLHDGGANFTFCDGSVRFLSYSDDQILPTLATRASSDVAK